jgi:hypothetical protein
VRDDPELAQEEKQWILGRSARRVFLWPASDGEVTPTGL